MIFRTRKAIHLAPILPGITSASIFNITAAFVLVLIISSSLYVLSAYSDGLFQDQISDSVGERRLDYLSK